MEKISLYDLLSILLPGAILTLAIELIVVNYNLEIKNLEINDYFQLTIFLSASIFIGSLINIISRKSLNRFRKIGLYTSIFEVYENTSTLEKILPFFERKINSSEFVSCDSKVDKIEHLWSIMYYELEANDKIRSPKTFQSFYFFFRNFFTLGFLLSIILLVLICIHLFKDLDIINYITLFIINLFGIALSIIAGNWNRKKMIERLFWTYYSLNKKVNDGK